ncbi:MAG: modulated sigma54 specific transcriptional regulator, Fis family [Nocardioides sp.]|nr:modulated sigma54 specific transcriptional regulator, Fis family [Nocardioides sp.]
MMHVTSQPTVWLNRDAMSLTLTAPDVRASVVRSWERSRMCGLDQGGGLTLPYVSQLEVDNRFTRAASPVLEQLGGMLAGCETAAVLLDPAGRFLMHRCDDRSLGRRMDTGQSTPGFVWAEEFSGTNAVGVALEEKVASWTTGQDHYLEALRDLSCAAAPIFNPFNRKLEGVIDLTALIHKASPLMMPMAIQAAQAIEERLVEAGSAAERTLLARFMSASRRPGRVVLVLGDRTEVATSNASSVLNRSDKTLLAQRADDLTSQHPVATESLPLGSGHTATVRFERIEMGGHRVGTLVELEVAPAATKPARDSAVSRRKASSGTDSPMAGRSQATEFLRAKVEQLRGTMFPLVISGEAGVGKLTLARMLTSGGQPPVLLDAGQTTRDSESALLREIEAMVAMRGRCVIVRQIGGLSADAVQRLAALAESAEENQSRVICTLTDRDRAESASQPTFGVRLHVPALRERSEDLLDLVPRLMGRRGAKLRLAPPVMQALMRYDWPGNVRELDSVLSAMASSSRGSEIHLADLPAHYQRGSRRLRRIEHVERSAIIQALLESEGNKTRAAEILEIGRATLYRKMRVYGLEPELISG